MMRAIPRALFVGECCVECKGEVPVYRKFFCEPCYEEMLKEPVIPVREIVPIEHIVAKGMVYQ